MFENIVINRENFPMMEVTLSSLRDKNSEGKLYTDRNGDPFSFYWLTINGYICATGRNLTDLIKAKAKEEGQEKADDKVAFDTLVANENKFQIAQAEDEEGPIFVDEQKTRPLLKIIAKAHSYTSTWD